MMRQNLYSVTLGRHCAVDVEHTQDVDTPQILRVVFEMPGQLQGPCHNRQVKNSPFPTGEDMDLYGYKARRKFVMGFPDGLHT